MNGKLIFSSIVSIVAILAAALYFGRPWAEETFFRSSGEEQISLPADEAQASEREPNQHSAENQRRSDFLPEVEGTTGTTDSEAAVQAAVTRVFTADSAVEMDRALDELAFHDPDYADWRRSELPSFCHPEVLESESRGNPAIKAAKEKFCTDYDHTAYSLSSEEREALNPTERFIAEITTALESAPDSHWSSTFTDLVRNAQFPDKLLLLNLFNIDTQNSIGEAKWRFGEELRQSAYPEANLLDAQRVALHLYTCRRFGGCEWSGYWTMMHCSLIYSGKCRQGSSFEDVLYQTTPPADFGLAMEILSRL